MQLVDLAKLTDRPEVKVKILFGLMDAQNQTSDSSVSSLVRLLSGAMRPETPESPNLASGLDGGDGASD